jgi:hypothetical protein
VQLAHGLRCMSRSWLGLRPIANNNAASPGILERYV